MTNLSLDNAEEVRDFLFTIIESMPHGILLADSHGTIITVNQQAAQLLNLAGSALQQHCCWDVIRHNLGLTSQEIEHLQKQGSSLVCRTKGSGDGGADHRFISIARNELKSPFLHISGYFLVFEDISFLSLLRTRVDRKMRFDAMQDMAINMSQELKNPLGSLELYASILKRELEGDSANERITAQMLLAIRTMDHLLDNYVTFTCLPEPRFSAVHVDRWMEDICRQLQDLTVDGNIEILQNFRHHVETVPGDRELLRQLCFNIGINALESMKDGGCLRIQTRNLPSSPEHPEYLEVRFIDTGCGIAEERLGKIFDPIYTTKERGSGLGLAIVHYITEIHGGFVNVESRTGKGSTFIVLLPSELPANCQ